MAMFIWVQFRLRLPIAVSVDAKRDVELAAEVGDEVRRVEVILDAREAVALDFDAIEATNELAIRVRVPEKEERLASVPAHFAARRRRENALQSARAPRRVAPPSLVRAHGW